MKEPLLVHSTLKRLILLAAIVLYFLAVGVALASSVPSASSVPNCAPGTSIASLQQSGGCKSGNLLFTNFQYNNSGLQITAGEYVGPANILVTATPFSVTFSTDYGPSGGFADCPDGSGCVEEAGSIDYDVSVINGDEQIAGLGLFGGVQGHSFYGGAGVSEVGCLGAGNIENGTSIEYFIDDEYAFSGVLSAVCPQNPSHSVLLNANLAVNPNGSETVYYPRWALFSPVSTMSLAVDLFVAGGSDLTSFTNAFFFVSNQNNQGNQNN